MQRRIRKPFKLNGQLYTNTGSLTCAGLHQVQAYRLVTPALFDGTPITFEERFSTMEKGDAARSDPKGALQGQPVTYRDKQFVLCRPPVILTHAPVPSKRPSTHRREHVATPPHNDADTPPRTQGPTTPRVKPTCSKVEQGLLFDLLRVAPISRHF